MTGILYGVGTGPGDPELLTIKALNVIRQADIIAIPTEEEEKCLSWRTVRSAYPSVADKQLLKLPFLMTKDSELLKLQHEKNAREVQAYLDRGKDVVFLTIGDPSIYSTYGYLHQILTQRGYTAKMISGIPSFCAAAASLGEILCEKDETLEILPASYPLKDALFSPGTKILMKPKSGFQSVHDALKESGRTASMVQNCSLSDERIFQKIEYFPENPGYFSIILSRANLPSNDAEQDSSAEAAASSAVSSDCVKETGAEDLPRRSKLLKDKRREGGDFRE